MNEIAASELNKIFWDELCGSSLARRLGVVDASIASLKKFDDWFLQFYFYVEDHLPFAEFNNTKVLEVGLGYGTIGQRIAASGADYSGLDIAEGPVRMMRDRLAQNGLGGTVTQGSILDAPFEDESFDWVVAIGCYHHTGDMPLAVAETWRVLKPGGKAVIMVYNAYSYRQWCFSFRNTWKYFRADRRDEDVVLDQSEQDRARYDVNRSGEAAPITGFFSAGHIRRMAANWKHVSVQTENVGNNGILRLIPRRPGNAILGQTIGLDNYCLLEK